LSAVNQLAVALFDTLPGLVDTWGEAAAAAAADWYDEVRDTRKRSGEGSPPSWNPSATWVRNALAGWATEPLNLPEPDLT
jgi:hypothetical protein